MCTLIVIRDRVPGLSFVLAHNRDEMLARPWSAPARVAGPPAAVYPRDDQAGGTWIGVNDAGVVAAITNRMQVPIEVGRRSRGELCRAVLGERSLDAALSRVRADAAREPYNGFNLVVGGRDAAWLVSYGEGRLEERPLPAGVSLITSRHDLDPPGLDGVRAAVACGVGDLDATLIRVLADAAPHGPDGYVICKHGDVYGTRSSSIITLGARARFALAPGKPCEVSFAEVELGW